MCIFRASVQSKTARPCFYLNRTHYKRLFFRPLIVLLIRTQPKGRDVFLQIKGCCFSHVEQKLIQIYIFQAHAHEAQTHICTISEWPLCRHADWGHTVRFNEVQAKRRWAASALGFCFFCFFCRLITPTQHHCRAEKSQCGTQKSQWWESDEI